MRPRTAPGRRPFPAPGRGRSFPHRHDDPQAAPVILASPLTWYWPSARQRLAPFCPIAAGEIITGKRGEMTPDSTAGQRAASGGLLTPRAAFWCALSLWVLTLSAFATPTISHQVHPLPGEPNG